MLIRPAIDDTDPIRYRRPTPDGQFSGNIIDEAMRPRRNTQLIHRYNALLFVDWGPTWTPIEGQPPRRITPQIAGLGFSAMAQRFAIGSRAEAVAYLDHDILGPRLLECTRLVLAASEKTITGILGSPDDMKFRSCMTLFDTVSQQQIFAEAIGTFYPEGKDPATLAILTRLGSSTAE
jgi:uncharacterized protein (DUF1810 family)